MKFLVSIAFLIAFHIGYAQTDTTLYGYIDSLHVRQPEIEPAFPGGHSMWQLYLKKNLRYTPYTYDITGDVIVIFTIGTDGKPSDIKIFQPLDRYCDKEAIRLITKVIWTPAIHNGKKVACRIKMPINFKSPYQ